MAKKLFSLTIEAPKERKTWAFSPVTRVVKDKTKYDRKRANRDWRRED